MRGFINQPLAKQLYMSLILPLFNYCNFVYDGGSKTESAKLEVLQNNALHAVRCVDCRYSATSSHNELSIDWLDVSRKKSCVCELYKCLSDTGPQHIRNMFKRREESCVLRSNETCSLILYSVKCYRGGQKIDLIY